MERFEDAAVVKAQRVSIGANLCTMVEPAVRRQPLMLEGRKSIDRDFGLVSQLFEGQAPALARVPEQIGHSHRDCPTPQFAFHRAELGGHGIGP